MTMVKSNTPPQKNASPNGSRGKKRSKFSWAFGLYLSERRILLIVGDLIALNAALLIYVLVRFHFTRSANAIWDRIYWFAVLDAIWLAAGFWGGIYNLAQAARWLSSIRRSVPAVLIACSLYLFIPYVTPTLPERRMHIFLFPFLAALGVILWRMLYAGIFAQPTFRRNIMIVGAGLSGRILALAIRETNRAVGIEGDGTLYNILGFIDDDPEKKGLEIEGISVLGGGAHLPTLARELLPDEIVLSITHSHSIEPDLFQAILECREMGIAITNMSTLYEALTGRVPVEYAGRNLHVVIPLADPGGLIIYSAWRRILDIALAATGCLFLAVVALLIWIANRLTSPGDLFYRQDRVGKGGQIFRIIKFRSMIMDAENLTGVVWAEENDPRITPVGRFLRRTRLDEIPQFWNVLKGEMSLIGPRPERPAFVAALSREIPFYRLRHAVKPGITGWAQVRYRYGSSVQDALIKLQFDLYYIKYRGVYLDLMILLRTVQIVLGLKGR